MALVRGHHHFDDHFTQIPNEWLRDTRLSFKARGLLALLMSHSPGWNMSIRSIAKANGTGLGTVKTAVEELEAAGYLVRSADQNRTDSGTFADYDWVTSDPFQNPVTVKPRHGEMEHKEEQLLKNTNSTKNSLARRISDDWQPNAELRAWVASIRPDLNVDTVRDVFVDYWASRGAGAAKTDWDRTFKNWVRREKPASVAEPKRTNLQKNLDVVRRFAEMDGVRGIES